MAIGGCFIRLELQTNSNQTSMLTLTATLTIILCGCNSSSLKLGQHTELTNLNRVGWDKRAYLPVPFPVLLSPINVSLAK